KAEVHHGSNLTGVVKGGEVHLEAGHGAEATLKGSARSAKITGNFSSSLQLGGLAVEAADVHLGHSSSATVNATSQLDYHLEFSSKLKYPGKPVIGTSSKSHGSSAGTIGPDDEAEKEAEAAAEADRERRRTSRTVRAGRDGDELITISLRS